MSRASGLSIKNAVVTIPTNAWNRAHIISQFFRDELGSPLCILDINLVETAETDQQLVSYEYNGRINSPYNVISYKYRGSSSSAVTFPWADAGYALAVVEGTHYNVTYIA